MSLCMTVNPENPEDRPLVLAAEVVQAGGLIVYPTDTLYGIGANAWNAEAVLRVQHVKQRAEKKPILVLIASLESLHGLTEEISPAAQQLMDAFWPGPLTLVFKASVLLPPDLTSGTGTIGVRLPSSRLCARLLELCGSPLTSTSANLSGEPVPGSAREIQDKLGGRIDLYLDAGTLPPHAPSTVIDVSCRVPRIVRQGAIPIERLRSVDLRFEQ